MNNNNKVCNPKTEVSKGMALNYKDYITCLLSNLKDMEKNYVIAMSEASNETLYGIHKDAFLKISDLQREVYEVMFRKGWYCLEKSETNKIDEKFQMLVQEFEGLNG